MAKSISVSDLKEHLSRYLRQVQRGVEIQVTNRGKPIARMVKMSGRPGDPDERRTRLVAAGVISAGRGDASAMLDQPPIEVPGAGLSESLSEERGDRV